jgi:hypothetical protein
MNETFGRDGRDRRKRGKVAIRVIGGNKKTRRGRSRAGL